MSPNFKTTQVVCLADGETILHITDIYLFLLGSLSKHFNLLYKSDTELRSCTSID